MESDSALVFINFFGGWWRFQPNKWTTNNEDWRLKYPKRIPILGCYNDKETMRAEIDAAADYGVDCFMLLWYPNLKNEDMIDELNNCLDRFITSENSNRLHFMIEYCNHPPFLVYDDDLWKKICDMLVQNMLHPSYKRINGKALFKIHGLHYFYQECGNDIDKVKKRLDILRKSAKDAGAGELLISSGVMASGVSEGEMMVVRLLDYVSTYGDLPLKTPKDSDYPYDCLINQAIEGCEWYNSRGIHYMPYVMSGWNPRPWLDPRPAFKLPTAKQWNNALQSIKNALETKEYLGIFDGVNVVKAFNIYAWNEFGEGGMVAPTLGEGYMKLEGIKKFFLNTKKDN